MELISTILTFLSFAMIGYMIYSFRKIRTVSTKSPLISLGFSLAAFILFWIIIGTSLPGVALLAIILAGATLGSWQGRKTRVWVENGKGRAQNTIWFLVIWSVCYGFSQVLAYLGQEASLNIGMGAMSLGTGVALGSQGTIFFKLQRAQAHPVVKCPGCGHMVAPGRKFCNKCGKALAPSPAGKPAKQRASIKCPGCGHMVAPGRKFCNKCGQPLA